MIRSADWRPVAVAAGLMAFLIATCGPGTSLRPSSSSVTSPPSLTPSAAPGSPVGPTSALGWPGRILTVVGQPDSTTISIQTAAGVQLRTPGSAPAWSPDGQRIAYVGPPAGGLPGLWIAETAAGAARPAQVLPEVISVTWSPKGTWLAIGRSPIDLGDSWLVKPDGTTLTPLAVQGAETRVDQWSPDGERVAGIASMAGGAAPVIAICSVPRASCAADGRGTPEAWSPDGVLLAFVRDLGGAPNSFTLDPATGTVAPLIATGPSIVGLAWSAGGRIAAIAGDGSLRILDRVGGESRRIAEDLVLSGRPSWSPDGRWLSVIATTAAGADVVLLEVDGTGRAAITDSGAAVSAVWAPVP